MGKLSNFNMRNMRLGHMALSIGINFVFWSAIGFFLGRWLDEMLGTEPWLMILGIVSGIGFSFFGFIREIIILGDMEKRERNAAKDDKQ